MKHKNSLSLLVVALTMLISGMAEAGGYLRVNGEPGRMQIFRKVKAIRCDERARMNCADPIYLNLNETTEIQAGSYIVGFENSIYPGFVRVNEGGSIVMNLEKLTVPSSITGSGIRVYRDFGNIIEQQKIFFTMFYIGRHFFRLDKANFGDLYLTGSWERDFVQRFTYEICSRVAEYKKQDPAGQELCAVWNNARNMMDLSPIYDFKNDGTFVENWVTYPGDVSAKVHPKYLVSVPMTSDDFVSVFPGAYRFLSSKKGASSVGVRTTSGDRF
ncbi:hypothetical protein D3C72_1076310 [compost metagenome]